MEINELTEQIIGSAIEVHRLLGPGLLESAYEECLCHELSLRKIEFERQVQLPVIYKGVNLDCGYRIDVLVAKTVVVEIKSVEELEPIHQAQVMTYLKMGRWKIGLLFNFNSVLLKNNFKRIVLGLKDEPFPNKRPPRLLKL